MRALFLALSVGSFLVSAAQGQNAPPDASSPLQKFESTLALTTPDFTVPDKWEVRWVSFRNLNVSVLAPDGTLVAGAASSRGALYVGKGGSYHLQIDCSTPPGMPSRPASTGSTGFENTINGGQNGGSPNQPPSDNTSPNGSPDQSGRDAYMRSLMNRPWQVEVVAMGSGTAQESSLMPNFNIPSCVSTTASSSTPTPPTSPGVSASPSTAGKLTEDQARAVVLIKGDNAEGTGFMIKTPDGPAVVTNIHVIANNPNLKITTNTGALVTVLSHEGRVRPRPRHAGHSGCRLQLSRDGARTSARSCSPATRSSRPATARAAKSCSTPPARCSAIGPERIEIDNPIYHGNSGGPVFHTKSGKVLGVVTEAMKVDMSNDLDKASFASRNSAISGIDALLRSAARHGLGVGADRPATLSDRDDFPRPIPRAKPAPRCLPESRRTTARTAMPAAATNGDDVPRFISSDEKIMKAKNDFIEQAVGRRHRAATSRRCADCSSTCKASPTLNMDQIQNAH